MGGVQGQGVSGATRQRFTLINTFAFCCLAPGEEQGVPEMASGEARPRGEAVLRRLSDKTSGSSGGAVLRRAQSHPEAQ